MVYLPAFTVSATSSPSLTADSVSPLRYDYSAHRHRTSLDPGLFFDVRRKSDRSRVQITFAASSILDARRISATNIIIIQIQIHYLHRIPSFTLLIAAHSINSRPFIRSGVRRASIIHQLQSSIKKACGFASGSSSGIRQISFAFSSSLVGIYLGLFCSRKDRTA